nr:hypothetical protein [Tanacetum cinerariifolium]
MLQVSWLSSPPLHEKYRPPSQTLRNNMHDKNGNRTVNMAMAKGISIDSSATNAPNDAAINDMMDQLQNQLNQMILMMQNNKETTSMSFMSSEDSGVIDHVCISITYCTTFKSAHKPSM